MNTKKCSKCGKELPLTEFYSRGNGKLRSECKECHKKHVKEKYQERKNSVEEIKSTIGCAKCGEKRPYTLDFHHLDPNIKDATVARMTSNQNRIEDIQREIDKCIVLCSNCHREFHHLESTKRITIEEYLL